MELRAFDGSLNETKEQALSLFEEKYGFRPKATKPITPATAIG